MRANVTQRNGILQRRQMPCLNTFTIAEAGEGYSYAKIAGKEWGRLTLSQPKRITFSSHRFTIMIRESLPRTSYEPPGLLAQVTWRRRSQTICANKKQSMLFTTNANKMKLP